MGPDAMIFVFECWVVSQFFCCCCCFVSQFFHSPVSLSSRGLFSPSSLSAIWVLSSVYLRLFLFPPAILIQACASSSLAFHMMCSASNLNKQGYNSEPVHCCMVLESVSIPKFFVSLFLFISSPTSLWANWLAFLSIWCPLSAYITFIFYFNSCFTILCLFLLYIKVIQLYMDSLLYSFPLWFIIEYWI